MNFLLNMENCALPCYCTRGYSVALLYFIFQFWDVEPICDHWVIGWSAMAFWWYFDLGATQTKHHEQVPWDWRSIHIYQPHISDDTIHIRRYIDPEYVCCNRFWHVQQHIYTVPPEHLGPVGVFIWDEALAELKKQKGKRWSWLREKWTSNGKTGKGGELRHFCWAHLMHLATGNGEP